MDTECSVSWIDPRSRILAEVDKLMKPEWGCNLAGNEYAYINLFVLTNVPLMMLILEKLGEQCMGTLHLCTFL